MKKQKTVAEKQNQTNTRQTGSIVWAKEWSVRICSFAHSRIKIEAENLKKESYEDSNCVCVSVYIPIFDMYSIQTDNEQCGRQRILLSLHLEWNGRKPHSSIAPNVYPNDKPVAVCHFLVQMWLCGRYRNRDWFPAIEYRVQCQHLRTIAKKNSGCLKPPKQTSNASTVFFLM